MKPKKVMWLLKGLGTGGTENLLAMSLPYLNREEFSYEVAYLLPWKNALVKNFSDIGIPVTCMNHRNHLDLRIIPRLSHFLKEHNPDLLEIHLPYTGIVGRIAAKLAGTRPILYVEHSLSVQIGIQRMHILGFLGNMMTYPINDYVVTVSQDTQRDIQRYSPVKKPTQVIYNGIDLAKVDRKRKDVIEVKRALGIPDSHKVVGHVANLLPKKRQDILLKAAREVLDVYPDVTFVIVGRGPREHSLKSLADRLGIADNIIFTGFVDDLYEVMQTFDIYVMSSQHEGFGISLVEAMAMGSPAVVTRVGGMPEVVEDGVSGLLTEPAPSGLAEHILTLLKDDELRKSMGLSAMERVRQKFDIRKRVAAMEDVYRKLITANNGKEPL